MAASDPSLSPSEVHGNDDEAMTDVESTTAIIAQTNSEFSDALMSGYGSPSDSVMQELDIPSVSTQDKLYSAMVKDAYAIFRQGVLAEDPLKWSRHRLQHTPLRVSASGTQLLPHQLDAVGRMLHFEKNFHAAILADDMGLGKTLMILSLILESSRSGPTIIILPLSLVSNWEAEISSRVTDPPLRVIRYCGPQRFKCWSESFRDFDIVLTTYETVRSEWTLFCQGQKDAALRKQGHSQEIITNKDGSVKYRKLLEIRPHVPLMVTKFARKVLDEGHRITNSKSKVFQAVCAINAELSVISTGTPFQNEYSDLGSLFSFTKLSPWNDQSFFRTHFCLKDTVSTQRKRKLNGQRNAILALVFRSISVRRHKEDTFENNNISGTLPEIVIHDSLRLDNGSALGSLTYEGERYRSELETQTKTKYLWSERWQKVKQQRIDRGDWEGDGLTKYDRFREIAFARMTCAHFAARHAGYGDNGYFDDDPDADELFLNTRHISSEEIEESRANREIFISNMKETGLWDRSTKINVASAHVMRRLEEDEGKILVFSEFLTILDILEIALDDYGIKCLRYDGTMSELDRSSTKDEFQLADDPRVMLLTCKAGGQGLTLIRATTVIILTPCWNPSIEQQCIARANRIGQNRQVTVIHLDVQNGIERHVRHLRDNKAEKAEAVLERRYELTKRIRDIESWDLEQFQDSLEKIHVDEENTDVADDLVAGVASTEI